MIAVETIPENLHGAYVFASVKFIDNVGRWKLQLNSYRAGLLMFTDKVMLTDADLVVDDRLAAKKVRNPDYRLMWGFAGGRITEWEPPFASARRVNVLTRDPANVGEARFIYADTKMDVGKIKVFWGDSNGKAWVWV